MPRADRTEHNGERDKHRHTHTRAGTRRPSPISPLPLQTSAGNRAVQRTLRGIDAGSDRGDVIRRRWNPPYLEQRAVRAARLVAGTDPKFTRYVVRATNPLQEGVRTFLDSGGPLPGAMQ